MSEWQRVKFEDLLVGKKISYGVVQPGQFQEVGGIPLIRVNNIKNAKVDVSDIVKIHHDVEAKYSKTRLCGGELLITVVGSVGECAIVPEDLKGFNVARAVSVANIIDGIDKRFVAYQFRTEDLKFQMYGNTNDTVQPTLNLAELKQLNFILPSLPEQKVIASVLSSLDDKIDLLHRQNKTLEEMAETLFRQWFIEEAKEDWEEVQVKDYTTLNRSTLNKNYPFNEILYLDTGSLNKGVITELQPYQLVEAPSRAKRLVRHNDILISTVRPNQCHYGIVSEPQDNLVVSTGFCTISCDFISPYFIYLLLTNEEMTEYLHSIAEGSTSTYPSLKPEDIGVVTFNLPPKDLLGEFHELAESHWKKIHSNLRQIQTLEKLRDTLLPKLMSGEVRVEYKKVDAA